MEKNKIKANPFVKWAGGKTQLLSKIRDRLPHDFNKYIEPFLGGGAVFFDIESKENIINDVNSALINTYVQIRDNLDELIIVLDDLDNNIIYGKKEFFYKVREDYNYKIANNLYNHITAAEFIFLNKHAFNGLYRVNSKGEFNVPYNNSISKSYNLDNLILVKDRLKNTEILNKDFEDVCDIAKKNDFIFLDSPYDIINNQSFTAYTKIGFDESEHRRLAQKFMDLNDRGCLLMLTNHNTELINTLYEGFNKEVVTVKRMINSDSQNRKGEEIIITNY